MSLRSARQLPTIALVGRANVGKSLLWNRITETGRALVSEIPHTTRDRNAAPVVWRGQFIEAVDTGGLDAEQGQDIGRQIVRQAEIAIRKADIVLFLVDAKKGVSFHDQKFAKHVRGLNSNILLVANKVDHPRELGSAFSEEFWSLGLGEPTPCSAATGAGVGDLLDVVYRLLIQQGKTPHPQLAPAELRLVVMGRPNVGKSSLVNAMLQEERVMVSPTPHTTREPIDTEIEWKGQPVVLVDTAGMRRRARVAPGLEEEALERNRAALARADIAFLVLDATEDPTQQDRRLAGLLQDASKGLAILVNKWDLIEAKTTQTARAYEDAIRSAFPFLWWAPFMCVSAKTNLRAHKLFDLAFAIREERRRTITYNALQKFLKSVIAKNKPLSEAGTLSPYIHDVTQVGIEPPTFVITVRGQKATLHKNWLRYFENRLREKFGFSGTPIVVKAQNVELRYTELPEEKKRRVNRKKRPMGRRVGRY